MSSEERMTELEKKVAFQDQIIEDLNQVVVEQSKRLELLEKEIQSLREQLSVGDFLKKPDEETPPPHY